MIEAGEAIYSYQKTARKRGGSWGFKLACWCRRLAEYLMPTPKPDWLRVHVADGEYCVSIFVKGCSRDQGLLWCYDILRSNGAKPISDNEGINEHLWMGQMEMQSHQPEYIPTMGCHMDGSQDGGGER